MFWRYMQRKWKKISLISVIIVVVVLGIWSLKRTPTASHVWRETDFHPTPYKTMAQCEREENGHINCPDIRHKGKTLSRRAQLVLTRVLRIFDLIAKKYGVRYWLFRGTLLGAVRHQGHNPFDADVDICMLKVDFEKFIKFGAKELPEDIFFQTVETDVHFIVPPLTGLHGKLRDRKSCYKTCLREGCKNMDGLQMDMHVVENEPDGIRFIESLKPYSGPNLLSEKDKAIPIARNDSEIFPLTEVNFDGFLLPAPREWKKMLKSRYGDFMTIPYHKEPGHIFTDALRSCEEIKDETKEACWFN